MLPGQAQNETTACHLHSSEPTKTDGWLLQRDRLGTQKRPSIMTEETELFTVKTYLQNIENTIKGWFLKILPEDR
jgi:hypothetical protein